VKERPDWGPGDRLKKKGLGKILEGGARGRVVGFFTSDGKGKNRGRSPLQREVSLVARKADKRRAHGNREKKREAEKR